MGNMPAHGVHVVGIGYAGSSTHLVAVSRAAIHHTRKSRGGAAITGCGCDVMSWGLGGR